MGNDVSVTIRILTAVETSVLNKETGAREISLLQNVQTFSRPKQSIQRVPTFLQVGYSRRSVPLLSSTFKKNLLYRI